MEKLKIENDSGINKIASFFKRYFLSKKSELDFLESNFREEMKKYKSTVGWNADGISEINNKHDKIRQKYHADMQNDHINKNFLED